MNPDRVGFFTATYFEEYLKIKSLGQIFLITSTDTELDDCHSIIIVEDGSGKRLINYKHMEL
jgi:hypothetical protein